MPEHSYEMDHNPANEQSTLTPSLAAPAMAGEVASQGVLKGMARHTLGLLLLLVTVCLWTGCNFLGSSIFADNTYAKPFFMTYLNSSAFILAMGPTLIRSAVRLQREGDLRERLESVRQKYKSGGLRALLSEEDEYLSSLKSTDEEHESFLKPDDDEDNHETQLSSLQPHRKVLRRKRTHLAVLPTSRLALKFSILWFSANYFAFACLQHTTVASATILSSTSSIWTLIIGSFTGTERFTIRKLLGVLASLVGIIIISRVDLGSRVSANNDDTPATTKRSPSTFPDKPPSELALGDAMALLSAIIYGFYTITLKRVTLACQPLALNMSLFFGLVGFFNILLLWPVIPILHLVGIESFALPPNQRVLGILLINSFASLISDICWAQAMVLTSPLVVTVGLSLTIPLSLVGEIFVQGRLEGWVYWVGAAIVVGSFVFVDREEVVEERVASATATVPPLAGPVDWVGADRAASQGLLRTDDHEDGL